MFKIIKTQKRPNTHIPFFHELTSDAVTSIMSYFMKNYKDTGKFISVSRTLSEDALTSTTVTIWRSHEDFLDLVTDGKFYDEAMMPNKAYDDENNILTITIAESEQL
jgi:hypothetical protein